MRGGMRRAKTGGERTGDEWRRDEVRGQAIEDNVIGFIISSSDLIFTILRESQYTDLQSMRCSFRSHCERKTVPRPVLRV